MNVIEEGYIIERHNGTAVSYIYDSPRIAWNNPEQPKGLIEAWKKTACQPRCVTNKVVKVKVVLEDV